MAQYHQNTQTEKKLLDKLDNVAYYPTPEGLMLSLMPAGLLPRAKAWLIDSIIRTFIISMVMIITIVIVFVFFSGDGAAILLLSVFTLTSFLTTWLYSVYFEVYRNGMTPGKKRIGIYVCHDDGTPISLQASMIRNLLKIIDFLPSAYLVGVFSIMFNRRLQRLGDIVAGTVVVYQEPENIDTLFKKVFGFSANEQPIQLNTTTTPPYEFLSFALTVEEQASILSFAERSKFLSETRQHEICQSLTGMMFYPRSVSSQNPMAYNSQQLEMVRQALLFKAKDIQGFD